MKQILSRVGIGSARVDTVLPKTTLAAGESVEAEVRVEGGSSEQEVDAIYFALLTRYETEDHIRTGVIDKFHVADRSPSARTRSGRSPSPSTCRSTRPSRPGGRTSGWKPARHRLVRGPRRQGPDTG